MHSISACFSAPTPNGFLLIGICAYKHMYMRVSWILMDTYSLANRWQLTPVRINQCQAYLNLCWRNQCFCAYLDYNFSSHCIAPIIRQTIQIVTITQRLMQRKLKEKHAHLSQQINKLNQTELLWLAGFNYELPSKHLPCTWCNRVSWLQAVEFLMVDYNET